MNTEDALPPILVADDNATDVFFLQRRLYAAGISNPLHHVEDGLEATQWLERNLAPGSEVHRPWIVFVDLKMPRMDGFGFLQWLQEHGLCEQLTIVVLTTSDEPVDIERARVLGAHDFLIKYPLPCDLSRVAALAAQRALSCRHTEA